jgi:hypothetical protein
MLPAIATRLTTAVNGAVPMTCIGLTIAAAGFVSSVKK